MVKGESGIVKDDVRLPVVCLETSGHAWHVVEALRLAVEARETAERQMGYVSDSAILATWRKMLRELDR